MSNSNSESDTTSSLPSELLESLVHGNLVLFHGCDLPLGFHSNIAPPCRQELANELAKAKLHNKNESTTLERIAESIELEVGRHSLVQQVIELVDKPHYQPTKLHLSISQLPLSAIITTCQDELLETAFRQQDKPYSIVVEPIDLPFSSHTSIEIARTMIIKVRGTVSRPDSLILTRDDNILMHRRLNKLFDIIRYLIVLRSSLIIGHNPENEELRTLYAEATDGIGRFQRRAYFIWQGATSNHKKYWAQRNVSLLDSNPHETLERMLSHANKRLKIHQTTDRVIPSSVDKDPYKFLDYYTFQDADIFFGREVESKVLFQLIFSRDIVLVLGPSGSGKTSLLQAGVIPRLLEEGYRAVYLRAWVATTEHEIKILRIDHAPGKFEETIFQSTDINALMPQELTQGRTVIIIDQFEEILLGLDHAQRALFYDQLLQTAAKKEFGVRVVVCIREDFLPKLYEGHRIVADLLNGSYHLSNLDHDNAYIALTLPAKLTGVNIDEQLVDELLSNQGLSDKASGLISPASLQIICDRLYQEAKSRNHGKRVGSFISKEMYDYLGGGAKILLEYLDYVLGVFHRDELTIVRELLKLFISSNKTKKMVAYEQLEFVFRNLSETRPTTISISLDRIVHDFIENRLIRAFESDGQVSYELMHDFMALRISEWLTEQEVQTKLVYELLQREVENWLQFNRTKLIDRLTLDLIDQHRDNLWYLKSDELYLICISSLAAGYEYTYWVERAQHGGILDEIEDSLLSQLTGGQLREDAISILARINSNSLAEKLIRIVQEPKPLSKSAVKRLRKLAYHQFHALNILSKLTVARAINYLRDLTPAGMVLIPAGEFIMGSGEYPNEAPPHKLWLDSFYISRNPVTNSEYKRFIARGGYRERKYWTDDGWQWLVDLNYEKPLHWKELSKLLDHPVVGVSWFEALAFCRWAKCSLPTEAEWEKAASWDPNLKRKRRYPWGDEFEPNNCNTNAQPYGDTTPVLHYSPMGDSSHGCTDMAGNVWEWCSTAFRQYPYQAHDGREVIQNAGVLRVKRGGSYLFNPILARGSSRLEDGPSRRSKDVGIRYVIRIE